MTTIAAIAKPMVFLDISTSSPHSSAQRMLRPIPRIVRRPGYPEGYPGHVSPLYALASLRTTATRNGLEDLYHFAVLFDQIADEDDALAAGVGTLQAGVMRLYGVVILGRWVRGMCARLIHVNLLVRLAGPRELVTPRGHCCALPK